MANRSIEAKRIKMKKARRLFPKSYTADYIPVGRGPNRDVMSEYKERTRGLAFDAKYLEWLESITRFRGKPPGKKEAEEAIERLKNAHGKPSYYLSLIMSELPAAWARIKNICPMLMNVVIEDSGIRHVRMFWKQDRSIYILVEAHHIGRYIRASICYQSRERLLERFKTDTVRWVEFVSSSPPKPTD